MDDFSNNGNGGDSQHPNLNMNFQYQQPVPNAEVVLVLGIISIALCWCYGVIGLATGLVALILGSKSKRLYAENPSMYTESSYKNLNAGFICAIIGTALSGLVVLFVIIYFIFIGSIMSGIFSNFPFNH